MILTTFYKLLATVLWYNKAINTNSSFNQLVESFVKKGGRIDRFYLRDTNRNKRAVVHLNGWFGGKNIKEALLKALG